MARHCRSRQTHLSPLLGSVLLGTALSAGAVLPTAGVAAAASSDPACVMVAHAQSEFDHAKVAYEKEKVVESQAHAQYERLKGNPKATAAEIEDARQDWQDANKQLFQLFEAEGATERALQDAVTAAHGHHCSGQGDNGGNGGSGNGVGGRPVDGHPGEGHPGPIHQPVRPASSAPAITVASSSSSTAVASAAPGAVPEPGGSSAGDWLGSVENWFDGSGNRPGPAPETAPDGVVPSSVVDGVSPALDEGHIGLAVTGLAGLGLGGTVGLLARRRRS